MRRPLGSIVGVVAGVCCIAALAAGPASATVIRTDTPFSAEIVHPCTGDLIFVEGVFHSHLQMEQDASGKSHWQFLSRADFTAVSVNSGLPYRWIIVQHSALSA